MRRWFITWFIYLFITCYTGYSQEVYSVDEWMEYIEEIAAQTDDPSVAETLYADLSYLSEHPFNLNTLTEEQLKKLPFLSDEQIEALLKHLLVYGQMHTLYELKNVKGLDKQTLELLLPFVYPGEAAGNGRSLSVKNLLKYGKNEISFRYDQCLQQKKGYAPVADSVLILSPDKHYLGESFYHSFRYNYAFEEKVKAGIVAEKDLGESFFKPSFKGYDSYSAHLFLQDFGVVKHFAAGDYKASFGQGLVISNDFTPARTAMVTQAEKRNNGFRRHFSTNETDFLRGTALTLSLKNTDISVFYSKRKLDAVTDGTYITSFKTDGLHRLPGDKEKEKQVSIQTAGGNIRYITPGFCLGATALFYSFGKKEVMPRMQPYSLFHFRGTSNFNFSVDYTWQYERIKIYGETALSKNGAVATLNALRVFPVSYLSILVLHRYYGRKYQAFFGNSFSSQGMVQNEQGIYTGVEIMPFSSWKISMYADVFRYPWFKYGIDRPSGGMEYMIQADYTFRKNTSFYIRYKFKDKETNGQHRLRLQSAYSLSSDLWLRTSLDGILYTGFSEGKTTANKGWMLAQHAGWKPSCIPFQADVYVACFDTDNYNVRLSSSEKNLLYAFSIPSFYGQGLRLAASFTWKLLPALSLSAKLAHVWYADRETIGTGLEEIDGSGKTDIYTLLRWKF